MTTTEIFEQESVARVEKAIIDTVQRIEYGFKSRREDAIHRVRKLLDERRRALNASFSMNAEACKCILELNAALRDELTRMYAGVAQLHHGVETLLDGPFETVGKCYLSHAYSPLHPVQTERARMMWDVLSGTIDSDMISPMYLDGVTMELRCTDVDINGNEIRDQSLNYLLYLEEGETNWDDDELHYPCLAKEHLIYPLHNLACHTHFALYDLLWVRDFHVEITVEREYDTSRLCTK